MKANEIQIGSTVFYTSPHNSKENGIVKALNESKTGAWVVYHCNNDWSNYQNYTGQHTNIADLTIGWHNQFKWDGSADDANKLFGENYGVDWSF